MGIGGGASPARLHTNLRLDTTTNTTNYCVPAVDLHGVCDWCALRGRDVCLERPKRGFNTLSLRKRVVYGVSEVSSMGSPRTSDILINHHRGLPSRFAYPMSAIILHFCRNCVKAPRRFDQFPLGNAVARVFLKERLALDHCNRLLVWTSTAVWMGQNERLHC